MAKKKQSQPLVTSLTANKTSEVASTAKKPSENPSAFKKPAEIASTMKKPSENPSPVKKPSEVSSTAKKKKQPEPVKNPLPESSSNEEEESETENESESETEPATKTPPPSTAAASDSPNKKRQSEGSASMEASASKRAKTESGTETAKKALFQRVWSEEDEVVLLQGIIDFRTNTGKSHSDDMIGFFERVRKLISFEVKSMSQFANKIWGLKKKYVGKRKNGVEPSFTKPHDKKCLELAKMVWGTDVDATVVKSKKKIKVDDGSLKIDGVNVQADWFERSFLVGAITSLGVVIDEDDVREQWSLVPVIMKKRIEEKWKSLKADELKCLRLKTDLVNEVSNEIVKFG